MKTIDWINQTKNLPQSERNKQILSYLNDFGLNILKEIDDLKGRLEGVIRPEQANGAMRIMNRLKEIITRPAVRRALPEEDELQRLEDQLNRLIKPEDIPKVQQLQKQIGQKRKELVVVEELAKHPVVTVKLQSVNAILSAINSFTFSPELRSIQFAVNVTVSPSK